MISTKNYNYKSWLNLNTFDDFVRETKLKRSWKDVFDKIKKDNKDNFEKLNKLFKLCIQNKKEIFPYPELVFTTFNYTSPNRIKVVIIGQDPYFNKQLVDDKYIPEAMGMSFSVPKGVPIPSSLQNIFKNGVKYEHLYKYPEHGNLETWNRQGVLLLNTALTVQEGIKLSHAKYWNEITDSIIKYLSDNNDKLIFVFWGAPAYEKKKLINLEKHYYIASSHPSGLSCHKPMKDYPCFMDLDHFGLINKKLKEWNKKEIFWSII
jgi:uracil-DNA glycosylase